MLHYSDNNKPAFRGVMASLGAGNSSPVQNTSNIHTTTAMSNDYQKMTSNFYHLHFNIQHPEIAVGHSNQMLPGKNCVFYTTVHG